MAGARQEKWLKSWNYRPELYVAGVMRKVKCSRIIDR
jgi:hypothetical protein